ncbi:MAG: SPOR domain-containing protein [Candidatus Eisenbacteria bacterium]|nr:SPOR domain-containing protein [Candidatus Eisenbacteria bacterium]
MKLMSWFFILMLVFAVCLSGCAKQVPKPKEITAATPSKEVEKAELGDIEEAELDTLAEPVQGVKDTSVVKTGTGSPAWSQSRQTGFSVQVFASSTSDGAVTFASEARGRFSQPVFIVFEEGLYKVRVGGCLSRQEADELKARARDMGYADSWVVAPGVEPQK